MRISLLFCILIFVCSCGNDAPISKQDQTNLICGTKWIFDWGAMQDSLISRPVSEEDIGFFNGIKVRTENAIFDFKENGIFEVQTAPNVTQAGRWYLNSINNTLKMEIYKAAKNNPLPILKLTKDRFELGPDTDPEVKHAMHRIFVPYKEQPNTSTTTQ